MILGGIENMLEHLLFFQSVHEHTTSELSVVGCLKSGSTSRNYDNIFLPKRDPILKKRNQILDLVFHLSINKQ